MSTDNHAATNFAHHFKSRNHEDEACKQGVWLILATEILMFGALFVLYALFRGKYPEAFAEGSAHLDVMMGSINTVFLISSSFTMALAIHFIKKGNTKVAIPNLVLTLILAGAFLVVKYFEYSHKIHDGLLPGGSYFFGTGSEHLPLFFGIYFVMTGLHGIHILIGMGLITWILIRTKRGDFDESYNFPVEGVGLYWHIVDLIWIYLFPLLYLI